MDDPHGAAPVENEQRGDRVAFHRRHRLGGRLFVLAGLGLIALGILGAGPEVLLVALVGGLIALLIVIFVYSYRVWQTDPTRRTS